MNDVQVSYDLARESNDLTGVTIARVFENGFKVLASISGEDAEAFIDAWNNAGSVTMKERDIAQEGWHNCRRRYAEARQECGALRKALATALAHCDAAKRSSKQYHDERDTLYRTLGLSEAEPATESGGQK